MDEYRNFSNGSIGNSLEVVVEYFIDFSIEIMNVIEMEQLFDDFFNVNVFIEESEMVSVVDFLVILIEIEVNFFLEYEKFWKIVENNFQDFIGWVYLF